MPDTVPTGGNVAAGLPIYPFSEFRDQGLLWLVNKVVFHPRGYALAFHRDEDTGEIRGWTMIGDGTEVWQFMPVDDDDGFAKAEAFLNGLRE